MFWLPQKKTVSLIVSCRVSPPLLRFCLPSQFSLTAAQLAVVKRLWRRLKAEAETAQAKAVAVRDQSSRVWAELMDSQNAEQAMREASARQASRIAELERLLAGDFTSGGHELEEVEAAEETLKAALAKVGGGGLEPRVLIR